MCFVELWLWKNSIVPFPFKPHWKYVRECCGSADQQTFPNLWKSSVEYTFRRIRINFYRHSKKYIRSQEKACEMCLHKFREAKFYTTLDILCVLEKRILKYGARRISVFCGLIDFFPAPFFRLTLEVYQDEFSYRAKNGTCSTPVICWKIHKVWEKKTLHSGRKITYSDWLQSDKKS